ncbi:MAG: 50S ribosomal protein L19e [Candidatus Micrarchaeia archaeon]|jgi:large subunit ribosomal protein L19e
MATNTVRRIASEILRVGESKVRFKTDSIKKIEEALTREDIRTLIKDGTIYKLHPRGVSRARGMAKRSQTKKGRRGGMGSRRGTPSARLDSKDAWIAKVRAQRRFLSGLISSKKMTDPKACRKIYLMVKGNAFKSVKILEVYLRDNKLLAK